jgi:hypothetical protein
MPIACFKLFPCVMVLGEGDVGSAALLLKMRAHAAKHHETGPTVIRIIGGSQISANNCQKLFSRGNQDAPAAGEDRGTIPDYFAPITKGQSSEIATVANKNWGKQLA